MTSLIILIVAIFLLSWICYADYIDFGYIQFVRNGWWYVRQAYRKDRAPHALVNGCVVVAVWSIGIGLFAGLSVNSYFYILTLLEH